jgi:hypothetical protein
MLLGLEYAHPHLEGFFLQLLDRETDRKLHRNAGIGLLRCRLAGESAGVQPC